MVRNQEYTLLLIEDDLEDAFLLFEQLDLLKSIRFKVNHKVRLSDGIKEAQNNPPDLILLDLNLPDSAGIETVERTCAEFPGIPVVVLTGQLAHEMGIESVNLGAQDYLIKGAFSEGQLQRTIQYAISRKDIEERLRNSEALMLTVFNDVSVGILLIAQDLTVLKINKAGLSLSGRQEGELIGNTIGYAIGCQKEFAGNRLCGTLEECHGCQLNESIASCFAQKNSVVLKELKLDVLRNRELFQHYFNISTSFISSWEKPVALLTMTEITDLRKYQNDLIQAVEKAEESDMLKTAFLANMSHEIRTPLNSVQGFADLLLEDEISLVTHQQAYLKQITNGVEQLLGIVNNVVEMSKIQAGQLSLHRRECYPKPLILETFNSFFAQVYNNSLDLKHQILIPGQMVIQTDPDKLRSIINNLLSNAVKFTQKGSVLLLVSLEEDQLKIVVRDTGIGIESNQLPMIFKSFYQVENGLNKLYGGNGLGLTITKHYVELFGGQISVESTIQEGSTFTVRLPIK